MKVVEDGSSDVCLAHETDSQASCLPSSYMLGFSEQVASMADAILIVQARELPVHTYILAANSPVLADLLETAQNSACPGTPLSRQKHRIEYHWKETACQLCAQY